VVVTPNRCVCDIRVTKACGFRCCLRWAGLGMRRVLSTRVMCVFGLVACVVLAGGCVPVQVGEVPSGDEGEGGAPPGDIQILALEVGALRVHPGGETWIECSVADPDDGSLAYEWSATGGTFSTAPGSEMTWVAPEANGDWVVVVTVRDPAGNSATESVTLTVGENVAPTIRSVLASASEVAAGGSALITCVADDPEGDVLAYSWSAADGEVTGTGSNVTWFAPDPLPGQPAEYPIVVTVDDGYGGTDSATITLDVEVADTIKEFAPMAGWSWTACTDGTTSNRIVRAGDGDDNEGYRAFWTYDLERLRGAGVVRATLVFTTAFISASAQAHAEDNPFNAPRGLGPLHVYRVSYERDGLAVYDPERVTELTSEGLWQPPDAIDVTDAVRVFEAEAAEDELFQVMAAFERDTNRNMFGEYIVWSDVILRVYYSGD